ncbi:MAG: glycerol kinase [Phycisphaerales bacterium]|nr:glycerol kinase [Phycisphaerales bacterium]
MARSLILALDQGTSSSRSAIVNREGQLTAVSQREFRQHFPQPGWVEHDAREIWKAQFETAQHALASGGVRAQDIAAIGITNQRETIVVWDRATGEPIHNALVWQDRRTAESLAQMRKLGVEGEITAKTGLLLDPYFSASKLEWILDNVKGAREGAERGQLAAGTIDSWLIWNLTGGRVHVTDVSNASRTMLMDLRTLAWDPWLLKLFNIPGAILPMIIDSSGVCGETDPGHFGHAIPIAGVAGDQQCALFGQSCVRPGMSKTTFGTGCFLLANTGTDILRSRSRLLTTVAWRIKGSPAIYALEGSVFMGGASVQWLRDGLGIIRSASEVNELAARVADSGGVVMVPAFTGLGAPHWDASARGAILGLTRGTTAAHIARATLEGVAMQVVDVIEAMNADMPTGGSGQGASVMRVDGGACASNLLMQLQADLLGMRVERPAVVESTALGAAFLAGLATGVWSSLGDIESLRRVDCVFEPTISVEARTTARRRWKFAVEKSRRWEEQG